MIGNRSKELETLLSNVDSVLDDFDIDMMDLADSYQDYIDSGIGLDVLIESIAALIANDDAGFEWQDLSDDYDAYLASL